MVLDFGVTATPVGPLPTGMVAVTLMAVAAAGTMWCAEDAAATVLVATGATPAMDTVIKSMARWLIVMASCFLAGPRSGCLLPSGPEVTVNVQTREMA